MSSTTVVEDYVAALVRGATEETLPDETISLIAVNFPEVPAFGATVEDAAEDLYNLLEETVRLALQSDQPLPVVDGIDLNSKRVGLPADGRPPPSRDRRIYRTDEDFLDALG